MARMRRMGWPGGALLAGATLVVLAGCGSATVVTPPPPTPSPTPAPTATPLPGETLAPAYRPEGSWTVTFSRPGDIVRETFDVTMTCVEGPCDAIVAIDDARGTRIGKGTFVLRDGRYFYDSETQATVDCTAGGTTVRRGATQRVTTALVLARYRIAGTASEEEAMQGTRTVVLEPVPGSACSRSTVVYPAAGAPAGSRP